MNPLHPAAPSEPEREIEDIEVDALVHALRRRYGHDFTQYARASLIRRLRYALARSGHASLSQLQGAVLRDRDACRALIADLSVTTTEMFRDPPFYEALRRELVPLLRTYPSINVWIAGCATGEEAYSVAILLSEEGLYDRSRIYATDTNQVALDTAREGVYPADPMRANAVNYRLAGGASSFSSYWRSRYGFVAMTPELKRNLVFSDHNLATDGPFASMHLVLCRNVLIYFTRPLQDRVVGLLADSLVPRGFLGLGTKESLRFLAPRERFDEVSAEWRLFRLRDEVREGLR